MLKYSVESKIITDSELVTRRYLKSTEKAKSNKFSSLNRFNTLTIIREDSEESDSSDINSDRLFLVFVGVEGTLFPIALRPLDFGDEFRKTSKVSFLPRNVPRATSYVRLHCTSFRTSEISGEV